MREACKAFICYRRRDSFVQSQLHERVKTALENLGFDNVFLDTAPESGARAQEDYEAKAFRAVETCDLFVALIGTKWLNLLKEKNGGYDATAREIRIALHYEKEILPVLIDDAAMPALDHLPGAIRDFHYKAALEKPLASDDSTTTIERAFQQAFKNASKNYRSLARWRSWYIWAALAIWFICGVLIHIVGISEYGWQSWWGMAAVWGGFFIWPVVFFPFALFGIYRPFMTLVRFAARSSGVRQRSSYAIPLIASTLLATLTWIVEVYDPHEVPWTIEVALSRPGCRTGLELPPAIANLSPEERRHWLVGGSAPNAVPPQEARRWRALINLSSYDEAGSLHQKYGGAPPFWLTDKCWPNVFYYLTAPIYNSSQHLQLNDLDYQTSRRAVDAGFTDVLLNANRAVYGVKNSWTAWVYRASFFFVDWAGISGISMAVYFAMVSLRDPKDDSVKRTPREDALLCLTYSMATVMTWVPFRMVTEYIKFLYWCPDITGNFKSCRFDVTLYMPDLLLAALLLVGYLFVTIAILREYHRFALAFYGSTMIAITLLGAFAVYRFHEQVIVLVGYWQFYLVVVVPSVLLLLSLWYLFDPSAVRSRDRQRDLGIFHGI
jgi:hypothetical protein